MISKSFSNFFDTTHFRVSNDSFEIIENDKSSQVQDITFVLNGCEFDYCTDVFWALSERLYEKNKHYSFRDHCDGVVHFRYNSQDYLVWIELKSSFSQVFKKAVFQISSCYIKMHSYISIFQTLNQIPFKEFGIVVSLPENSPIDSTNGKNAIVSTRRLSLLSKNNLPEDVIRKRYRSTNSITVDYTDLGNPVNDLTNTIVPHNFPIVHIPISTATGSVDLLPIINSLFA